jgi:hypothetical protein
MHARLGKEYVRPCLVCNNAVLVFDDKTSRMSSVCLFYAPAPRTGSFLAPHIGVVREAPLTHLQPLCGFLYDSYAVFGVNSEENFRVCHFCSGKQFTDKFKKKSVFLDITQRPVVILGKCFEQNLQY